MLTITEKIGMALARRGLRPSDLARAWPCSPQNMIQRIKRGSFSNEEMQKIADIIGCEWIAEFRFPDGTRI